MADGKQTTDPGKDKPSGKSEEKISQNEKDTQARKARAEIAREADRTSKERETEQDAKKQRAGVAIEVTGQKSADVIEEAKLDLAKLESDQFREHANSPEFANIKVRESAEKQRSLLFSLAGTTIFELVPYLLNQKNVSKVDLDDCAFFQTSLPEDFFKTGNRQGDLDLAESFAKIQEILKAPDGKGPDGKPSVKAVWIKNWEEMMSYADNAASTMRKIQPEPGRLLLDQVSATGSRSVEAKPKSFYEEHSTAIKVGALGLGIAAAVYLTSDIWGQSEKDKAKESSSLASSFFGKLFKLIRSIGLLAGVGFGLGRFSEIETVRKWLKTLNIDDNAVVEALRLYSHGRFQEAIDRLGEAFDGGRYEKAYQTIADKINAAVSGGAVRPETIEKIKDVPYRELFPQDLADKGSKFIGDLLTSAGGRIPLLGDLIKKDPLVEKDLKTIAQFLALPENQQKLKRIAPGPKMTMRELLLKLCDIQIENPQTGLEIPPAVAIDPVGKDGKKAHKKAEIEQAKIEGSKKDALIWLAEDKNITPRIFEKVKHDTKEFHDLLTSIEGSEKSWAQTEGELIRRLFRNVPGTRYEDQDYIEMMDQIGQANGAILQDLRTQSAALVEDMEQVMNTKKPLTPDQLENFRVHMETFYGNYTQIHAKLDEVNQKRIQEQEELNKELASNDTEARWDRIKNGLLLTFNTFFGIPYSVVIQQEANGKLIKVIGYASLATGVYAFGKGMVQGKGLVRSVGKGVIGLSNPVRVMAWEGLVLSKRSVEYLDYLNQGAAIHLIQQEKLTVTEGMTNIQGFLKKYGYQWEYNPHSKMGQIVQIQGERGVFSKLRGRILKKDLSEVQIETLKKNMQTLEELKAAHCEKWSDGVAMKIVGPQKTFEDLMATHFVKQEEELIAAKMKEIVAAEKKTPPVGRKPLSGTELREEAMTQLRSAKALESVKDMEPAVKNLASKTTLDALPSNIRKIEELEAASKNADLYYEKALLEMSHMKKAGIPQAEIVTYAEGVQKNLEGVRTNFNGAFKEFEDLQKAGKMSAKELEALETLTGRLMKGKSIKAFAKATGSGVWKGFKGRAKLFLVFGAAKVSFGVYEKYQEDKQKHIEREFLTILGQVMEEGGPEILQMALDIFAPFGASDWYAVYKGHEAITGKELNHDEKIRHIVFGTYNAVTDVLAVVAGIVSFGAGGGAVYGAENVAEIAMRAGSKAPAIQKVLPRLSLLAKEAGGFGELAKLLKSEKIINALKMIKFGSGAGVGYYLYQDIKPVVFAGCEYFFDSEGQPEHEVSIDEKKMGDILPPSDLPASPPVANDNDTLHQSVDEVVAENHQAA